MYKCKDEYRRYQKQYQKSYYKRKRDALISHLGGACSSCGSEENLEFDHIDPESKEKPVSKIIKCRDVELMKEASKCQVLCKDCHLEKSLDEGVFTKNVLRGSQVGVAKLDERTVSKIRKETDLVTDTSLAQKYGVSRETIRDIRIRRTWKHI